MLQTRIKVPGAICAEASYVLRWVLSQRLGVSAGHFETHDENFIEISVLGSPGALKSPCIAGWRPVRSDQVQQLACAPRLQYLPMPHLSEEWALPILFGSAETPISGETLLLPFDLFGTIFWHLARVEELETEERDRFDVYNARQSFAYRTGLLRRPIVDEYIDYLWHLVKLMWPGAERSGREHDTFVTCDVDVPYSHSLNGFFAAARTLGADILLRRSSALATQTLRNLWRVKTAGDYSLDPFNSFEWYIDQCNSAGRRAAFYFISGNPAPEIDNRYELTHPAVRMALTTIAARGHEIGMHASYTTYRDAAQTVREFTNLKENCGQLGIVQPLRGNRQHYLRWDWKTTPDILVEAGFGYDTTLGYNDMPGFRCGTCHEFPLWSWKTHQPLALRERPLIAMAGSLVGPSGLNLSYGEAHKVLSELKDTCRKHHGTFVCLWHNNEFRAQADRELFKYAIS